MPGTHDNSARITIWIASAGLIRVQISRNNLGCNIQTLKTFTTLE